MFFHTFVFYDGSGVLKIFNEGIFTKSTRPALTLSRNGAVTIPQPPGTKPDDKDHLDSLLKGAVLAKDANGAAGVYIHASDETGRLMMAKAAALAGLTIKNPPEPGKTLDQINPGLAKRMEQEWTSIRSDANRLVRPTTATGIVDTSNLVKPTPSALDSKNLTSITQFNTAASSLKPASALNQATIDLASRDVIQRQTAPVGPGGC